MVRQLVAGVMGCKFLKVYLADECQQVFKTLLIDSVTTRILHSKRQVGETPPMALAEKVTRGTVCIYSYSHNIEEMQVNNQSNITPGFIAEGDFHLIPRLASTARLVDQYA